MTLSKTIHIPVLIILTIAALLPLCLVDILPLLDYLNHLARDYVLAHYNESDIFRKFYQPQWAFLPNLAMDLAIVPLAKFMSIDLAGKLFLAAIFILTASGVFALSYALHGRVEWPAYLIFLFLYHRLILWGYLNFSFGIALALWGFALWLLMRNQAWATRFVLFTIMAVAILLCHLFAFAVYLLFIGGYQLGQTLQDWRKDSLRRDLKDWALIFAHIAVPVILFLVLSPTTEKSSEIRFGSFIQKLTPAFHVVNNYYRGLDYATFFLLVGFIALGLWRKWLTLATPILWPLVIGGLIQLVIPDTLFGSQTADSRLPIVLWMLLAAGLQFHGNGRWFAKPILLGFLALILARLAVVAVEWHKSNAIYGEYLAAFETIEPGSKLLAVVALPRDPSFHHPPINFIASRAVIGKSTFDPFMFADYGHQPLSFTESYQKLAQATPGPIIDYSSEAVSKGRALSDWENPFKDEIIRQYDYLLLINGGVFHDFKPDHLQPVHRGSNFVIYRIER
ncbi:MAG: hypothetical protein ACXW1V_18055 [Methylomagnum sp.]